MLSIWTSVLSSPYQKISSSPNQRSSFLNLSGLILRSSKTLKLCFVMLSLTIANANRYATIEFLVLQSIISILVLKPKNLKAGSRKTVVNEAN